MSRPVLALVAGCAGGDAERVDARELRKLVLQPADLPAAFERFDFGALTLGDANPGARSDPSRFEREGGWKARYKRSGSPATHRPLVVESKVDAFVDDDGAERDLGAYAQELDKMVASAGGGAKLVRAPAVGDAAIAITIEQAGNGNRVRFFTVAWRRADVSALVGVTVSRETSLSRMRSRSPASRTGESRKLVRIIGSPLSTPTCWHDLALLPERRTDCGIANLLLR